MVLRRRRDIWDSVVAAVLGNGAVTGARLRHVKNGELADVACSGVFPFVGVEPNTAFLPPSVRRDEAGCVITDDRCRTSKPAVFAIGALRSGYGGDLVSAAGEAALAVAAVATLLLDLPIFRILPASSVAPSPILARNARAFHHVTGSSSRRRPCATLPKPT